MKSFFTAKFFKDNRKRLRASTESDLIVITANGRMQRTGDNPFAFRQDSNFWYLTGIDEPDLILVMDKSGEYLIVPDRDPVIEIFDGQLDGTAMSKTSAIVRTLPAKTGFDKLSNQLRIAKKMATIAPSAGYVDFYGFYTNPAKARLVRRLKGVCPGLVVEDLRPQLAAMRMRKQPPELRAMQSAIDITLQTLNEISRHDFEGYHHEYELEAAVTEGFRRRGASGHAFSPIVASGEHSCQIHHMNNDGPLIRNSQLLFDVAAEVSNYSSDISRTYFIGTPTRRYQDVYEAVQDVYSYALGRLKPGIIIREYEKLVEAYMGKKLNELGLIDSMDRTAIRHYYPHATSHFLGLDTHDVGDYSVPIERNMVLTVEPGIYIPEEGIGIRIEDDVLITNSGHKVLSGKLPQSF